MLLIQQHNSSSQDVFQLIDVSVVYVLCEIRRDGKGRREKLDKTTYVDVVIGGIYTPLVLVWMFDLPLIV